MKRLILLLYLSVVIGAVHAQTGRLDLKASRKDIPAI